MNTASLIGVNAVSIVRGVWPGTRNAIRYRSPAACSRRRTVISGPLSRFLSRRLRAVSSSDEEPGCGGGVGTAAGCLVDELRSTGPTRLGTGLDENGSGCIRLREIMHKGAT